MGTLLLLLLLLSGLVSLGCFIVVLMQMFQNDQGGWGMTCIVLTLCFGAGQIVGLIYGWIRAEDWNIRPVMVVWSIAAGINVLLWAILAVMTDGDIFSVLDPA